MKKWNWTIKPQTNALSLVSQVLKHTNKKKMKMCIAKIDFCTS